MTKNKVISLPATPQHQVEDEIKRIAIESTERVILLDHARDRMDQRDITMRQILNVLRYGDRKADIAWNTDVERGWKCSFTRITAGVSVTVGTKLVDRDDVVCLIVTVY